MPQLTEEQRLASESIDTNVLVSAGAGSGKTMVLVERYLEVLRKHDDATVSDVVAVTFTRKAAEEMRSRLKARLREITGEAQTEEGRLRWGKLLADVDRARIGTIHSLCESLLKAFPAEAGVDPQFEIVDDLTRAKIIHDCVEAALQGLISEPDDDSLCLLEYPIESIRGWVISRLEQIPQYKEARRLLGDSSERLEEQAQNVIRRVRSMALMDLFSDRTLERCFQYLQDNPWPDPDNKLEIARAELCNLLSQLFAIKSQCAGLAEFPDAAAATSAELLGLAAEVPSPGNSGGAKGKPLRDVLAEVRGSTKKFVETCPLALNEADLQAFSVLRALVKIVDIAIADYEAKKVELQRLDYNDLIGKTHSLLCSPGSTAAAQFGDKLRAVLVDEFQDTNHIQAAMLSSICRKNGRLFLIGDDKQSIYKFQGADVSTFNEWKSLMKQGTHGLNGDSILLDLSFSFRSHPSIVDFVNRFFQFYFHSDSSVPQAAHRAEHRALVASRADEHDPQRVDIIMYDAMDEQQKRSAESARLVESRGISAWILEKVGNQCTIYDKALAAERPMSFGDFAVLVQANSDFSRIESALADAGIPYVTYAGSGFLNRQEILDLENMMRWLSCTEDDHALIAILRSPFFGVNDGIIHKVYTEGQSSLWQSLQRACKSDSYANLRPVVESLRVLFANAEQSTLSDLLRSVVQTTGYDIVCLSLPNGKQKSRNIWKFISFAREYNHMPMSEFLAAMASMRELGVTKQTDAPLNAEDSVKLMTIHKSKGLEFPAVILPVMGRKVHLFSPKLLVHRDFGLAFDTTRSAEDQKPAFFKASLAISNELDAEEKKRLLYVAMTRARDFLAVFIEQGARNETSFRLWVKQALGLDSDSEDEGQASKKANLFSSQHYQPRYFDELGVQEWETAGRGLASKFLTSEDVDELSKEIGFDLLQPLSGALQGEVPAKRIHWHRAERVTLPTKDPTLHPTVVGNLFHAVMQHILNSHAVADRDLIARLSTSAGVNAVEPKLREALVERAMKFVSVYESSTLKEMVATATRVLSEINYTVVSGPNDADKRPDLILQDTNGQWRIIDFKTDHMTAGDVPAKVNAHSHQLLQYVRDFEMISGAKATGWLYFAELGRLEEIQAQSYVIGKKGQLRLPIS